MQRSWPLWLIAALTVPLSWGVNHFITLFNAEAKPPVQAAVMNGCRVLNVHDGDTLRVRCGLGSDRRSTHKVRLYCIDAPELAQAPWGKFAREHLRRLAGQDSVQIRVKDRDEYRRTVAEVWKGTMNLNLAMVKAGKVAVYRRYCKVGAYQQAEVMAKSRRIGIWTKPGSHQRPWEWRH
jgi:endonuclease YncB( thermonuclease family)